MRTKASAPPALSDSCKNTGSDPRRGNVVIHPCWKKNTSNSPFSRSLRSEITEVLFFFNVALCVNKTLQPRGTQSAFENPQVLPLRSVYFYSTSVLLELK